MQQEFECISIPLVDGLMASDRPGRLNITGPSTEVMVLGGMSSMDRNAVTISESYSRKIANPLLPFLEVCVRHELCLNKYLSIDQTPPKIPT
jgi:hypothetical protein